MAKLKQTNKVKSYKAADGQCLPIYYNGSIIKIGKEPVEIDFEKLGHEPQIQFLQAIKDKSIFEVGG